MRRARPVVLAAVGLAALAALGRSQEGDASRSRRAMMREMMGARLPRGIEPSALPEAASADAALFARSCAQCHELPSPAMHAAG